MVFFHLLKLTLDVVHIGVKVANIAKDSGDKEPRNTSAQANSG